MYFNGLCVCTLSSHLHWIITTAVALKAGTFFTAKVTQALLFKTNFAWLNVNLPGQEWPTLVASWASTEINTVWAGGALGHVSVVQPPHAIRLPCLGSSKASSRAAQERQARVLWVYAVANAESRCATSCAHPWAGKDWQEGPTQEKTPTCCWGSSSELSSWWN